MLGLTSCQQLDFDEEFQASSTKTSTISKFNVSLCDVNTLVGILDKNDSKKQLDYIEPLAYNGDTLLYVVNYKDNKGWRIISGDRRTTSIFASADDGVFKLKEINPGVGNWLVELADNVLALKQSGKQDSTLGDFSLWRNIDKLQYTQVKVNGKSGVQKILDPEVEGGYWELYDVTSESAPITWVGPLLFTKWGQEYPWNVCVPWNRDYSGRCATGCAAVAIGQTMRYLNDKIGVPVNSFEEGRCFGYSYKDNTDDKYYGNYGFSFVNPTSISWLKMAMSIPFPTRKQTPSTDIVAVLMGWIGYEIGMRYDIKESSLENMSALPLFFNNNGINCTFKDYNSNEVINSLNNEIPVIIGANATEIIKRFFWITWSIDYQDGHMFVVDGYQTNMTKYTYRYKWIDGYNDPTYFVKSKKAPTTTQTEKIEEYISTTQYLRMNWGNEGSFDHALYSINSDWNFNSKNYKYNRKMLIGFSKK